MKIKAVEAKKIFGPFKLDSLLRDAKLAKKWQTITKLMKFFGLFAKNEN